jgi:sulfotransferase
VELLSRDKILKVMAVTRFHFISGMPTAGAELLTKVLDQNPAFTARSGTSAAAVFQELIGHCRDGISAVSALDQDSKNALMRGSLDAVFHSRPLESVVFDNNPLWMSLSYELCKLMPLSRLIFVVRDPASIAAEMARDSGAAITPASLMAETGQIGGPMVYLKSILSGPNAERVILIDRARLMSDPVAVLDVLYRFLRIGPFEHDVSTLETQSSAQTIEPRGLRRIVSLTSTDRKRNGPEYQLPVWRRMRSSDAVMVLAST